MIVRNKVWEEIKQAHVNILCLKWYTYPNVPADAVIAMKH